MLIEDFVYAKAEHILNDNIFNYLTEEEEQKQRSYFFHYLLMIS